MKNFGIKATDLTLTWLHTLKPFNEKLNELKLNLSFGNLFIQSNKDLDYAYTNFSPILMALGQELPPKDIFDYPLFIGSSKIPQHSIKDCQKFLQENLAKNDFFICCGGPGFDKICLDFSRKIKAKPIVVLPTPLNNWSPKSMIPSYKRVIKDGGYLYSFFYPQVYFPKNIFRARNRVLINGSKKLYVGYLRENSNWQDDISFKLDSFKTYSLK